MNVLKAAQAFRQHWEEIDPQNQLVEDSGVPSAVLELPSQELAQLLLQSTKAQDSQDLTDEEWTSQIEATNDPLEAGGLIAAWLRDRTKAALEQENFQEWERQPEEARQPYSDGTVPPTR